jgi:hypothetical protein
MPPTLRVVAPSEPPRAGAQVVRRHYRAEYERPAEIELEASLRVPGRMLDISEAGFCLNAAADLAVGKEVLVRYVEPLTHCVRSARAVARWSSATARERGRIGFSFDPVNDEARDAIRNYVAYSRVSLRPTR